MKTDLSAVENFLSRTKELTVCWGKTPEVIAMPFRQSETEKFLLVAVDILPEQLSLSNLWNVTVQLTRLLAVNKLLTRWKAVEIVVCRIQSNEILERILKFGVMTVEIPRIESWTPSHLLNAPTTGPLFIHWYVDPPSLSESAAPEISKIPQN